MCDSIVHPHTVGREPTNSCSSVSDISEAISDMSLSTSPGSDLPTSISSCNMMDMMASLQENKNGGLEKDSNPYPRKKRVMRQLSSNPYLASSELSPDEQSHPIILGANSYAGESSSEVSDGLYPKEDINSLHRYQHIRANSFPLASDFTTNSDDSEDDDKDESVRDVNKTNHYDRHPDPGHNYFFNEEDTFLPYSYQSSNEMPPSFQNGRDDKNVSPFQHVSSSQCEGESFEKRTYHSMKNNRGETSSNNPTDMHLEKTAIPIPAPESFPLSQSRFSSVQLRKEKERHHSDCTYNGQPQSREINSWGHFSKHTESHYKYRRSHCNNSSDSDDENQRFFFKNKSLAAMPSERSQSQSHNHSSTPSSHHCQKSSPSEKASTRYHTTSKNQNDVSVSVPCEKPSDVKVVKPLVFKDRFQVIKRWFSECNDGQKNVILKGLLKLCELPQLHLLSVHMSRELHHGCPSNCEDILTWLPTNLATRVMAYLDPVSLCRAAQVCSVWRSLAEEQSLWRRFCCQAKWRLSKAAEHKQVISHMSLEGSIQWKNVFAERFRLRNNWLKGRCTVRTFEGHHQGISCVQFDDSRIVSGSSDKTIKVWNMRTNAPWSVQTLMGHHGTVRCLHLEGNRLVSGSCDCTIKVWDLSTDESWSSIACKVTMTGHTDTVRCLQADDDKVISGSYDKTLKIWDLKSGELRQTLRGHQGSVLCVHFSETKIVSGSVDKTIKVWSYEGHCVTTLCGHQDAVTCLMFDATRIVSGSLDHNLKFWDVHSGECLNTIDWKMAEGHTGVVRCLQADSWRVVSAGDDKTIKVWNLATGERLVTLRNHSDGVTCLQFNDFIIVSGSYDKTVKLWDFSCC